MWRDVGSVGTLLHTQAHKQTPIRPSAHSATSTRASAQIHAAMPGMPCPDPAHACVYAPPRTPGRVDLLMGNRSIAEDSAGMTQRSSHHQAGFMRLLSRMRSRKHEGRGARRK